MYKMLLLLIPVRQFNYCLDTGQTSLFSCAEPIELIKFNTGAIVERCQVRRPT